MRVHNIKRFWGILLAVVCLPMMLVSCMENDEEKKILSQLDGTCYISSVTLGTVKRIMHTTDSLGKDSTYYSKYTGSTYRMIVDQRTHTIENRDSLLYESDLSAILISIAFEGGTVAYRVAGDTAQAWKAYKSSDSIDLRKPIELFTLSRDGHSSRIYTMKVNVHQVPSDVFQWNKMDGEVSALADMTEMQSVMLGGNLTILGQCVSGVKVAQRNTATGEWTTAKTNLPATANVHSVQQSEGVLYVSTTDGVILKSADGAVWEKVSETTGNVLLVNKTQDFYYALMDGELYRSADAENWQVEALDDVVANLPAYDVKTARFSHTNGDERLVMVGCRRELEDTTAVVWNKVWNAYVAEQDAEWMYFCQTADNRYFCPQLEYLNVLAYDGVCLAFGGESLKGNRVHNPMDAVYVSQDYGITWKYKDTYYLPEELEGVSGPITSVVDEENFIWIVTKGQVWRGRLNRLGFVRQ